MSTTLIKQLKGVSTNSELPYYNAFVMHVNTLGYDSITFRMGIFSETNSIIYHVIGGGNYIKIYGSDDYVNEISNTRSTITFKPNTEFDLLIKNKYDINSFYYVGSPNNITDYDVADALRWSKIIKIAAPRPLSDSNWLDSEKLLSFINIDNITDIDAFQGDIDGIKDINYTKFSAFNTYSKCYGNLTSLPITIENCTIINSNISGSFESFVAHQRKLLRTSGEVTFKCNTGSNSKVTFNGDNLSVGDSVLSWDATTITWAGETISNSDVEP